MGQPRVAILGAGAWGTALAGAAAAAGCQVALWGRDADAMARIDASRENHVHLPGVRLAPCITVLGALDVALASADCVIAASPAQPLRALLTRAASHVRAGVPLVVSAKGIERTTGLFMGDVARQCWPDNPPFILSGPSFASDVGRKLPTAVTLAGDELAVAEELCARLGSPAFRLYHSDDPRGVAVGGAAKNVLAIACGIAQGRGLGASAVAALQARAFAELSRFGRAVGGRAETLAGLSGLGDLVLTCGSAQSRNFSFGLRLGDGGPADLGREDAVVEGVWTAPILAELAVRHGVDMPIAASVAAVLDGRLTVADAIDNLLSRPFRAERS